MTTMIERSARGAAAGAIATVPMTAVMLAAQRMGSLGELPPRKIARRALAAANQEPSTTAEKATAAAAHLGFGALAGAVFGLMVGEDDDLATGLAKGVGFGLALYALSYAGWIPALDIMPPPHRDREERQASIAMAHVVYGAALGAISRT
ncbi:MAG TPA: hypothetical protein VH277_10755 [Gemmatimonadaceae bacterium]|nr:hypothetical protein [Gemmatimonadaceae bacterium]